MTRGLWGGSLPDCKPANTFPVRAEDAAKMPRPRPRAMLEQSSEFFVSMTAQAH
jgi:hypothetical protein